MDGAQCGECSTFFKDAEEHGFPVLCKECWAEDKSPRNADGVNENGYQEAFLEVISDYDFMGRP